MTTESEPELTDTQKAYNVAQSNLFQLAAYGHCTYTPRAELLTAEGKAEQADYNNRIRKAREELEAAVLRLVAEHAETFRGDWGVPANWLRSLANDPSALSLLAVPADELEPAAAPVAVPPTGRAAVLTEAERAMLTYALDQAQEKIWSEDGFTDEDQAAVDSLRRMTAEVQQCGCGEPSTPGTVHRTDDPCHVDEMQAAPPKEPHPTEADLRHALTLLARVQGRGTAPAETVHACPPDGSGLTPCCGRTPFELPLGDRMSIEPDAVTCPAPAVTLPGKEA